MNSYQKYKENSVYSMSSWELLDLLYKEAIGRLRKADLALDDKEYALFDDCLRRASNIVRYLIDILDMKQPISYDLRRIYDYLILDISKVKAGREREQKEIGRISHILSELKDAFEQAAREVSDVHMTDRKGVLG